MRPAGLPAVQGRRARPAPAGEVTRAAPWPAAGLVSFPAGLANTRSYMPGNQRSFIVRKQERGLLLWTCTGGPGKKTALPSLETTLSRSSLFKVFVLPSVSFRAGFNSFFFSFSFLFFFKLSRYFRRE